MHGVVGNAQCIQVLTYKETIYEEILFREIIPQRTRFIFATHSQISIAINRD